MVAGVIRLTVRVAANGCNLVVIKRDEVQPKSAGPDRSEEGRKGPGADFVMGQRIRLLTLFHLPNRSKTAALLTAVRARTFM